MNAESTKNCLGESRFFWFPKENKSSFQSSKILGRRLLPSFELFEDSLLIALECRSYQKTNKQMHGHVAMIYNNYNWEMIFILQQKEEVILAYPFDRNMFYNNSDLREYNTKAENFFITYVNIYILDVEWYKKTDYYTELKNLASLMITLMLVYKVIFAQLALHFKENTNCLTEQEAPILLICGKDKEGVQEEGV